MNVEQIAEVCHEDNAAYCRSLGDYSQPHWDLAPDWQRQSCISGVQFLLADENATPRDTHEAWMRQKKADGWTYGLTKDPDLKTHPCMVDYVLLPASQRLKDVLFLSIVRTLRKHLT